MDTVEGYDPKRFQKLPCPWSPERLRELYGIEQQSLSALAGKAAALLDRTVVDYRTVRRWIKDAGMGIRSVADVARVTHSRNPQCLAALLANNYTGRLRGGAPDELRRRSRRATRAWRRKCQNRRIRLVCANPGCEAVFDVVPSRAGTAKYCCTACQVVGQRAKRHLASQRVTEAIRDAEIQSALGYGPRHCEGCGRPFTPKPNVLSRHRFCSRSCREGTIRRTRIANIPQWVLDARKRFDELAQEPVLNGNGR